MVLRTDIAGRYCAITTDRSCLGEIEFILEGFDFVFMFLFELVDLILMRRLTGMDFVG